MAKKLTRSTSDRWIAGICGGIGEYLEIDPNVIRMIWVVLSVLTTVFPGVIIYILLWIILPEQGQARPVGTYSEA
ncbi:PspC domain-containing protein [Methanoculleus horonobensis]|uniref:PspC domain-containing protein n=1 Tax=Methanoculleus horonobensis TaxID=528314 RepID=UPI00083319B7|nr:PspC domain-containing protein [Methanoculleus horonobensis]